MLRAASPRYSSFVGKLELGLDEGLAGWVARTKTPEFIRENAMADPRMKFVPELEEEQLPVDGRGADPRQGRRRDRGRRAAHARRRGSSTTTCSTSSSTPPRWSAGAIENAQLYEETRRRVQALTTLTQLSQALAAVTLREDLYDAVARGARELLRADACQIYRLDVEADELILVGSDPPRTPGAEPAARRRPAACST